MGYNKKLTCPFHYGPKEVSQSGKENGVLH
jgi:hypothetical protein